MIIREAQLRLALLGPPQVSIGNSTLTFPTRKTLALLIYLALEDDEQPREILSALLWPESSPERSYASLRNTLSHLRSVLGETDDPDQPSYLLISHQTLGLNPDADIRVDLNVVERAYALARAERSNRAAPENSASLPLLQEAAACHRGDFLAGFSLGDAPDFDDWAAIQSEVWRRRLGLILDRLSELQFARGELPSAAETASRWITLDTLNEVAYRRKMRAHFAAGERGQALETYEVCKATLAAELKVEPSPETEALAARVRTQHPVREFVSHSERPDTPVSFLENLYEGRTSEHQALVNHYKYAATGQPQVVVLRGDQGIGKTHLGRAFMTWAVAETAEALGGRTFESGSRMSYQPLVEAFRPLIERADLPLDQLGKAELASLSYLLPDLRERYPDLPVTQVEVNGGRTQLFDSLVHLTFILANRSPLVLFIDDLQWADNATLDWLVYAVRRWRVSDMRVLLLVSLRSEVLQPPIQPRHQGLSDWLLHVERETDLFHLELGPLSEQDTVKMLLSILSSSGSDFAQWVFYETRGQPFYLMETLKDLLERGALRPKQQDAGRWIFEVDSEHDLGKAVRVPSTVRDVILSRVNRLSPNAFALLVAGAVLDQGLTFERLCAISNVIEEIGLPALDELVSGRLLVEVDQAGIASTYTFSHNIIRDTIYTEAGDARRRLFHRRALDVLETAGESAAVLAHHALAAGLTEAAFRHSLTAGQKSLELAAAKEAQVHLEKARQLARETSLASREIQAHIRDLYLRLAEAYEMSDQPEQAQAAYDESKRLSPP